MFKPPNSATAKFAKEELIYQNKCFLAYAISYDQYKMLPAHGSLPRWSNVFS
jgi:hypothetical protein